MFITYYFSLLGYSNDNLMECIIWNWFEKHLEISFNLGIGRIYHLPAIGLLSFFRFIAVFECWRRYSCLNCFLDGRNLYKQDG